MATEVATTAWDRFFLQNVSLNVSKKGVVPYIYIFLRDGNRVQGRNLWRGEALEG